MKKYYTFKEVRNMFFEMCPEFKAERKKGKKQNDFSCDCRCTFVDFVECLRKNGEISDKQVDKLTLIG